MLERTVRVFVEVGSGLELPAVLVATAVNDPTADADRVRVMLADIPSGLTVTLDVVIAGGTNAGTNEKLEPVRLIPVTEKLLTVDPCSAEVGLIEATTGS